MTGAERLCKDIKDFLTFDLMVRQMGGEVASDLARQYPDIWRTAGQWFAFWDHESKYASGGAEK